MEIDVIHDIFPVRNQRSTFQRRNLIVIVIDMPKGQPTSVVDQLKFRGDEFESLKIQFRKIPGFKTGLI